MSKETGGPAFPTLHIPDASPQAWNGMTLRDYFAAKATDEDIKAQGEIIRAKMFSEFGIAVLPDDWRTKARWMHADAMLKARDQ